MKTFEVWIFDKESGCNQPMKCKARNAADARKIGNEYIWKWNLIGGEITDVREVTQ